MLEDVGGPKYTPSPEGLRFHSKGKLGGDWVIWGFDVYEACLRGLVQSFEFGVIGRCLVPGWGIATERHPPCGGVQGYT